MQHPDEGTIHAWLDGALSAEESDALEAHVAGCAECAARVAEARGLVAASSRIVSALDHVPSGVIPKEESRRAAWYTSMPFRAAASLVVVAGASLLLVRGNQKAALDRAMPAASVTGESSSAVFSQKEARAVVPDKPAAARLPAAERMKSDVSSGERRVAAPQVAAGPPSTNRASDEQDLAKTAAPRKEAASQSAPLLSDVVVTGVATAPAPVAASAPAKELKLVRSDTTAGTTRTLFEVSPGVRVTLVESPAQGFTAGAARAQAKARQAPTAAPPPAPVAEVAATAGGVAVNTISWVDKRGHPMSLTGPLSRAELETVRQLLPPDKR